MYSVNDSLMHYARENADVRFYFYGMTKLCIPVHLSAAFYISLYPH